MSGRRSPSVLRPLIPAWLDDIGLQTSEFRILCHLWRRADHEGWSYPATKSIALKCCVHRDTVWKVLNSLADRGLLLRQKASGKNHFRVLVPAPPPKNFGPKHTYSDGGNQGPRMAETEGYAWRKRRAVDVAETEGHEGSPLKAEGSNNSASRRPSFGPFGGGESGLDAAPTEWELWKTMAPHNGRKKWHDLTPEEKEDIWQAVFTSRPAA